jgi:hypothetical protein
MGWYRAHFARLALAVENDGASNPVAKRPDVSHKVGLFGPRIADYKYDSRALSSVFPRAFQPILPTVPVGSATFRHGAASLVDSGSFTICDAMQCPRPHDYEDSATFEPFAVSRRVSAFLTLPKYDNVNRLNPYAKSASVCELHTEKALLAGLKGRPWSCE